MIWPIIDLFAPPRPQGWEPMGGEDSAGVCVWKRYYPKGSVGAELPAVKATGLVPGATPRALADLILDSRRVTTYNKYSLGRTDAVVIDAKSKIVKVTRER